MNELSRRFRVAFSFAGAKRDFVAQVAALLAARFTEAAILYDKYHEAEFARRDLGFYLPDLYRDQSDLVVVVVCRDYQQKEWCGLEWDAIFELLKKRKNSEVMLCRFDHATVQGLFSTAGFVELDDKTPEQTKTRILERLALNEGRPKDYYRADATPVGEARSVHPKMKLDSPERTSVEGKSTIAAQPNTVPVTAIGSTEVSWLHLTDLHLGMGGQRSFWPTVKDRFFEDLKRLHEKCGAWDLMLFTGDLTQRGNAEEFQKVDEFLDELWERFVELGSRPHLLAIPGNHDLVRPKPTEPAVKGLCDWWVTDAGVRDEFWNNPESPYRAVVAAAFANYVDWWSKTRFKLPSQSGELPGDFSAVFKKAGASVGIVGLNTTFLQLTEGDYKGKLAVHADQFHKVCGGDGPAWVKKCNACLLLTHQPPDWLTSESQQHLQAEIGGYGYFSLHLFATCTRRAPLPSRSAADRSAVLLKEHRCSAWSTSVRIENRLAATAMRRAKSSSKTAKVLS